MKEFLVFYGAISIVFDLIAICFLIAGAING